MAPELAGARVFISYASEDFAAADALCDSLRAAGHQPWVDRRDLIAGQAWEVAIRRALREADVVLLLLSSRAVQKRGFVQREIRMALELWEEKLESDVFLVPARLDPCVVAERVATFHWVDLFERDGQDRVLRAISTAFAQRAESSKLGPYEVEHALLTEARVTPLPKFSANVSYVRFRNTAGRPAVPALERVNAAISSAASAIFEEFVADEGKRTPDEVDPDLPGESVLDVACVCTLLRDRLISVRMDTYTYRIGAAHGFGCSDHFNWGTGPFHRLALGDLFGDSKAGLDAVQQICRRELHEQWRADFGDLDDVDAIIEGGLEDPEAFGFNLTTAALAIHWPPYAVGPYSWGARLVTIPYANLKPLLTTAAPFAELFSAA